MVRQLEKILQLKKITAFSKSREEHFKEEHAKGHQETREEEDKN